MSRIEIPADALPVERPLRVDDRHGGVVVVRTAAGAICAFRDVCPHARWRLSLGGVVDGHLECSGHGMRFELDTGRCIDVDSYRLEPVAVMQNGGSITIVVEDEVARFEGDAP